MCGVRGGRGGARAGQPGPGDRSGTGVGARGGGVTPTGCGRGRSPEATAAWRCRPALPVPLTLQEEAEVGALRGSSVLSPDVDLREWVKAHAASPVVWPDGSGLGRAGAAGGLGGGHGVVGASPGRPWARCLSALTAGGGARLQVELEMAIDTLNPNYCRSKGEQIALNVDGACADETSTYSS